MMLVIYKDPGMGKNWERSEHCDSVAVIKRFNKEYLELRYGCTKQLIELSLIKEIKCN